MKRPMLISGIAIGLSCALLVITGIGALPYLLLCAALVFILYFIKPLKLRDKIIVPAICISVILACISFGGFYFAKVLPAQRLDKTITTISGKIISTPQQTAFGTEFVLKASKIGNESKACKIHVFLPSNYDADVKLYDYVSIPDARLEIVRNDYNRLDTSSVSDGILLQAQADDVNFLWESEKTPYYYCLHFKENVIQQIQSYLDYREAGILTGMLFGGTNNLDAKTKADFQSSGIAHLLAVSGLHTSTWCAYIILFLKLFGVKEKHRNIVCTIFLVFLCVVSGFTPSVLRASLMMAIILFAPFFKAQQDPLNSLGCAVAVLTLFNPYIVASISFLLSASATLGVLSSIYFIAKLNKIVNKIKNPPLHKITDYITNNVVTSAFAGLFTLPVTAYSFSIFCIVAPLTNLLCVTPAFVGMLSGVAGTAISFLPLNLFHNIAIIIFKVTTLILSYVTWVAAGISKFTFSTLPVHKEYFILCLAVVIAVISIGYLIHKATKAKTTIRACAIICSVIFLLSFILPCTPLTPATISVINVENGVGIALRQGLDYAFFNCGTSTDTTPYDYLPQAKCESLKLLYVSTADEKTNKLTKALAGYNPQSTILTTYAYSELNSAGIAFPSNTIVTNTYTCNFNNEITVQIVDTDPVCCVIIKEYESTVMVCYGNADLNYLFENYGIPTTLVLADNIPTTLPSAVQTLVISSNSDVIINTNVKALKTQCNKFYTTTERGNIKITM